MQMTLNGNTLDILLPMKADPGMPIHHLTQALRAMVWVLSLLAGAASAQPNAVLSACASHTPPFVLFAKGEPVSGFSLELLQAMSKKIGRPLRVSELPWAHCLQDVRSGAINLAIDAYDDAERRKTFLYSTPYHTLTPQVFYKAHSLLDTLQIKEVRDLERFKGCGVHDYTYEHYDLDAAKLDRGAASDLQMMLKLKAGHCDYAIEELEYIVGGRNTAANWPDESDLKSMRPVWARGPQVHFLIGRGLPGAAELLTEIDQAIAVAEKSGQTNALRRKYFDTANPAAKKR